MERVKPNAALGKLFIDLLNLGENEPSSESKQDTVGQAKRVIRDLGFESFPAKLSASDYGAIDPLIRKQKH